MSESILTELILAYRKAKVDLYLSSDPRIREIMSYEEDLHTNLSSLSERLECESTDWVSDRAFVGTYTFVPESVRESKDNSTSAVFWSDASHAWNQRTAGKRANAKFRMMSQCSIDMHVLSTYWVLSVGHKLELKLGPESMGNRIARTYSGDLKKFSVGTFQHYPSAYQRWRDGGLREMSSALQEGRSITALTADVSSFYHRLNPEFLLGGGFVKDVLGIDLTPIELKINNLFVNSLLAWIGHVSSETGWREVGLPVGLPASAVVANLALFELDRIIVDRIQPAYYARYVDDIMLVVDNSYVESDFDIWNCLIEHSQGQLKLIERVEPNGRSFRGVRFSPSYLSGSRVYFDNEKNKIFYLSGTSGQAMVGSIRRELDARSSERRSFTEVPSDPVQVGREIAVATQKDGEPATTLRDTDQVSVRRSAFATKLRDFEDYERNLDLKSWANLRTAFFASIKDQILVLPNFFDYSDYIPRLIKLATACGDWISLDVLIDGLIAVVGSVGDTCTVSVKSYSEGGGFVDKSYVDNGLEDEEIIRKWSANLTRQIFDNVISGVSPNSNTVELLRIVEKLNDIAEGVYWNLGYAAILDLNDRLHNRDLSHIPYRFSLLEPDYVPPRTARSPILPQADPSLELLPVDPELSAGAEMLLTELRQLGRFGGREVPRGGVVAPIIFSTRPPNAWELSLAMRRKHNSQLLSPWKIIRSILVVLRGHSTESIIPMWQTEDGTNPTWVVNSDHIQGKVRIALATVDTEEASWESAAKGYPDLSARRYERFKRLFREVVSRNPAPDYILLPEFAMPSQWFVAFADKLRSSGISLLSGIEYRSGGRNTVHNQVWASLRTGSRGSNLYTVYVQDKQRAARFERIKLDELEGLRLEPEVKWDQPIVISHGDFRFAILICSELTNIQYRSALRGHVDALFVPEWNQDIHSFEALVESAALDIHAYIVQANHLSYGDSRIRAPHKDEWERDILRLRGGIHDYAVIGEIDYWALREHQSDPSGPKYPFKPIPDGFEVSQERLRPR
ncbi:Reverse transcriptase [Rhodococcus erythropolis]|uniref:reverse transcriptase domain-containing protein n=1 Tax=Rhodococcus erythropolis TaxID=1833 RepID=UPI001C9B5951|nr:reverse transcriptase domain-containing protein [Rhodococcus erythropolis]MBY6387330.1 Reverse transcriptase [Rhodococcus erythropolis]